MLHPFEVGKTYRNRTGEYVVQSMDGDRMTIRYVGGATLETSASLQARIWENIQFEEQMVREEERWRQAQEARAARQRTPRDRVAKPAKPPARFTGFDAKAFEPTKRGVPWTNREELGRLLAEDLSRRMAGDFGHWAVPRQPLVHVARKEYHDPGARDTNAALFVATDEQGLTYGYYVTKPDGQEKAQWPWTAFVATLVGDDEARAALRSAMLAHGLSLDFYTTEVGYGQVAQVIADDRSFLWQHETVEQAVTRQMEWDELLDFLQTAGGRKRSELYVRKRVDSGAVVKKGAAIAVEIAAVLEALVPVYDASVGT